jgi:menaquinone-dependent protoporphyrinogen oxidase
MRCGLPAAGSRDGRDAHAAARRDDAIMSQLPTVLVAYASKHGSTREVADAVAIRLRERRWEVDLEPAADVTAVDGYAGVVLGAALYMGRPLADARRFLERHHADLASIPLAVFAMGPLKNEEDDLAGSRKQIDRALGRYGLSPDAEAVFGGVLDPAEHRFPFNHMPAGDARDWDAIHAFADRVHAAFTSAMSPSGEPVRGVDQR